MYYELVKSHEELVGPEGFLRLPTYIFDEYVFDPSREVALRTAIDALLERKNVLIVGRAGTGKTALLAMVLKELIDRGYRVAKIINGEYVRRTHEEQGIFLFYDDIPRIERRTIASIVESGARMIVATARVEEIDDLARKIGGRVEQYFIIVRIGEMSDEHLMRILERFARREGIQVEPEAARIVVSKAKNLPVYIWQVIRDLTIARKTRLDVEFANRIPEGMLEYVDKILWDVLGDKEDRKEVLLTLMIMTNMPEYEMHQDLFNAVFVEATKEIRGIEASSKAILLKSDTLDKVCRYLARTPRYSFRLPHDSWADVLKGGSRGLLSREISSLVYIFPVDEQIRMLKNAAKRAYEESIARSKDPARIREFFRQINLLGFGREIIGPPEVSMPERPVARPEVVPKLPEVKREGIERAPPIEIGEKVKLKLYATVKRLRTYRISTYPFPVKLSDISEAIFRSRTYRQVCNISRDEALRRLMYRRLGRTWTIKFPCWGELSITETMEPLASDSEEKVWEFLKMLGLAFLLLIIFGALLDGLGLLLFFIMIIWAISKFITTEWVYLSELLIEGDRHIVQSLVRDIRMEIHRRPIHITPRIARALRRRTGVSADVLERQWYVI